MQTIVRRRQQSYGKKIIEASYILQVLRQRDLFWIVGEDARVLIRPVFLSIVNLQQRIKC